MKVLRHFVVFLFALVSVTALTATSSFACGLKPKGGEPVFFYRHKAVVFMGSSSIDYWKTLERDFPQYQTVNLGVAGTTYAHVAKHAAACARAYPALRFVIYSGENDAAWSNSSNTIAANLEESIRAIRSVVPDAKVYVMGIKPSRRLLLGFGRLERANKTIRSTLSIVNSTARSKGVSPFAIYIDTYAAMKGRRDLFGRDGIHLNEAGYELWARLLKPYLSAAR